VAVKFPDKLRRGWPRGEACSVLKYLEVLAANTFINAVSFSPRSYTFLSVSRPSPRPSLRPSTICTTSCSFLQSASPLLRYHYILTLSRHSTPFRRLQGIHIPCILSASGILVLQLDISSPLLWIIFEVSFFACFHPILSLIHHISYG
jgi:hypothetical protein